MRKLTEAEGRFEGWNRERTKWVVLYTRGGLRNLARRVWWGKKHDGFLRRGDKKHASPLSSLGIDMKRTRFWDPGIQFNIPFYEWYDVGDGFEVRMEGPKHDYEGLITVRRKDAS